MGLIIWEIFLTKRKNEVFVFSGMYNIKNSDKMFVSHVGMQYNIKFSLCWYLRMKECAISATWNKNFHAKECSKKIVKKLKKTPLNREMVKNDVVVAVIVFEYFSYH